MITILQFRNGWKRCNCYLIVLFRNISDEGIVMSKISFISFCVEYYSDHIGISSDEVYKLFKNSGLIDLLNEDYDDLHGMGFEYLMQFIDEFFEGADVN